MNSIDRSIDVRLSLVVVQEEGKASVFIFVHLPELRVKRAFKKFFKRIPSNGNLKTLQFGNQFVIVFFVNRFFITLQIFNLDR